MMGVGGDTGRGARVAARSWRTWWRFGWTVATCALVSGALGAAVKCAAGITAWERHAVSVHMLSELMLAVGFGADKKKSIRGEDGTVYSETLGDIASFDGLIELRERVTDDILDAAMLGGGIGAGLVFAALFGLRVLGRRVRRGRRLRGGEPGNGRGAGPADPALPAGHAASDAGARGRALHRGARTLAEGRGDHACDRLRDHRIGQDRAHLGPRRADPRQGRALHRLRQDGELHRDLLRRGARRSAQPAPTARRALAPLVALPRGPQCPGLQHHGGGPHPPPEGHRRPLLAQLGAPALLTRRLRAPGARRDPQPGAGGPPAQDRAQRARRDHRGDLGKVPSSIPPIRRPRSRCGPCSPPTSAPWNCSPTRAPPSPSGSGSGAREAAARCSSPRGATSTRASGA